MKKIILVFLVVCSQSAYACVDRMIDGVQFCSYTAQSNSQAIPRPTERPKTNNPSISIKSNYAVVNPSGSGRTILPGCINGIRFSGINPSCKGAGVKYDDKYAIKYQLTKSRTLEIAENKGGRADYFLSSIIGEANQQPACNLSNAGSGKFSIMTKKSAKSLYSTKWFDPRQYTCILPAGTIYLHVKVTAKSCAGGRNCYPTILQY